VSPLNKSFVCQVLCKGAPLYTRSGFFSCDIVEDSRKDVVITSFLIFVLVSYSWNHQLLLFIFIDGFEKVDDFSLHDFFRDIMLMINFVVFWMLFVSHRYYLCGSIISA